MRYEVYCSLNINEYITVDADNEEDALIEARTIFADDIQSCNRGWKDSKCEVTSVEE